MASNEKERWIEAEARELASLEKNGVGIICDLPKGRKAIRTKWLYKRKRERGIIKKYKARLVAQGFTQIAGIDYTDTYSPVARFTSIRILFAIAAQLGLFVHQMDVEMAFLNAELQEEIYCTLPPGYGIVGKVWRLMKSLYGLKQSP